MNGMCSTFCDRQSSSMRWSARPITDANWSMMPHGTPANSCSAFWQSSAFSRGSIVVPVIASMSVAVATSIAALLERPPPNGHARFDHGLKSERAQVARCEAGDHAGEIVRPMAGGVRLRRFERDLHFIVASRAENRATWRVATAESAVDFASGEPLVATSAAMTQ